MNKNKIGNLKEQTMETLIGSLERANNGDSEQMRIEDFIDKWRLEILWKFCVKNMRELMSLYKERQQKVEYWLLDWVKSNRGLKLKVNK